MKKVGGRLMLLSLVIVVSLVFFVPTYRPLYQALPDWGRKVLPDKGITLGLDLQGGIHLVMEVDEYPTFSEVDSVESANAVVWELRDSEIKRIKDSAINQALETIRNRIDQFGVAEPLVQRQGLKQIVVQLPGVKDPRRAKALIKETALLEFKMLDEDNQLKLDLPARVPKDREAEVLKQAEAKLPEGDQILFERGVEKDTGREYRIPYVVKK